MVVSPRMALYGVRSPAPADDGGNAQMQRRLALEYGERDASRLTLHRLKTAVDFYRQRLQALSARQSTAGGRPGGVDEASIVQRARDLVREMDAEVRSVSNVSVDASGSSLALTATGSSALPKQRGGASYEVLCQSLGEAQRRCESLNADMVHQAEANEELVETLGTVKDANKRLLEQIRTQTDEIAKLTQERIGDEERMDQMTRDHEQDREAVREDVRRKATAVREASDERYNQVYLALTDKLRHVKARAEVMAQEAFRLREECQNRRNDFNLLVTQVRGQLAGAERDLSIQCSSTVQRHSLLKQTLQDQIEDLNVQHQAERDLRHSDGLMWGHKHGAMAVDKEDAQAGHSRDFTQLSSHLQALERTSQLERHTRSEDRDTLERQMDEISEKKTTDRSLLDQMHREVVSLESSLSALASENQSLEQAVIDLKRQIRESDDALAAAVSGNEHLRVQMEEQRVQFQDKNATDLNECKAECEQRLLEASIAHDQEVSMVSKQIESMEQDLASQEDEISKHRSLHDICDADTKMHERDATNWKSQCDATLGERESHEKKLNAGRQQFQSERLKIQANVGLMNSTITSLEEHTKTVSRELQDLQRAAVAQEHENKTHQAAAENLLREAQETLTNLQNRFKDVHETHSRLSAEASSGRATALETQASLQKSVDMQVRGLDQERARLGELLEAERLNSRQSREELDRERETLVGGLRRVHDESRTKLADATREHARMQEDGRAVIAQSTEVLGQQNHRVQTLEHELARVRTLLGESEANLAWVRQERSHGDREGEVQLRQLEEELRTTTSTLELARREEMSLSQQLDMLNKRGDQERLQLRRALDDTRRSNVDLGGSTSSPVLYKRAPMTAR